jgi:hypothetical protein
LPKNLKPNALEGKRVNPPEVPDLSRHTS